MPKSFDGKGFLITPTPAVRPVQTGVAAKAQADQSDHMPSAQMQAPAASGSPSAAVSLRQSGAPVGLVLAWIMVLLGAGGCSILLV